MEPVAREPEEFSTPTPTRAGRAELCPACGYDVVGIAGACPECGLALPEDRRKLASGRSPWGKFDPTPLPRGVIQSLLRPGPTLAMCGSPSSVTARRAVVFAAAITALLVLLWPVVREVGQSVALATLVRPRWTPAQAWESMARDLRNLALWERLWKWEAWSVLRWWVLLALLSGTAVLAQEGRTGPAKSRHGRSPLGAAAARLALLAPWVALLELGYLVGVWLDRPDTVPEPSTIFVVQLRWDSWLRSVWLWRGAVPSLLVGYVYFRHGLACRRTAAILGAIAFVPVAINWSIIWSWLWLRMT